MISDFYFENGIESTVIMNIPVYGYNQIHVYIPKNMKDKSKKEIFNYIVDNNLIDYDENSDFMFSGVIAHELKEDNIIQIM